MKKGKGLIAFFAMACVVSVLAGNVEATSANNWGDTYFEFNYNGDGSDVVTEAREKQDNTYTYVKSLSDCECRMNVAAQAKEGLENGDPGTPFTYDYCTSWYQVSVGGRKYFPNNAHKLGYETTYLALSSTDHQAHYLHGKWSPDNCSGYGTE